MWGTGLNRKKKRLIKVDVELKDIATTLTLLGQFNLGNSDAAIFLMDRRLVLHREARKLREELVPHMT